MTGIPSQIYSENPAKAHFEFSNKVVFIVSPQAWGKMKVSKHHYALELVRNGCTVYFIEPPKLSNTGIQILPCDDDSRIKLVRYKPVFRGKRFLPEFLFMQLLRLQVLKLINKIGVQPDILWCFQGHLFLNLKWFKAPVTIFFGADQFLYEGYPPEVDSSDISLAVSDTIYERLKQSGKPVFRINHGLHRNFVEAARLKLQEGGDPKKKENLIAGYTGNLRMEALDRATMSRVIEANPDIHFIFWGSYKENELNLGGVCNDEVDAFVEFLEKRSNVELRGVLTSEELQRQMQEADLFWLCWNSKPEGLWDGSNSHKILEYLSTGCPVVAHYVSSYRDTDLLYMLPTRSNEKYAELFRSVVELVKKGEEKEIMAKRLRTAVAGSYMNRLKEIEKWINHG